MPPGFQEDPELMAAVGGGAPQFQEDDDLLQALQAQPPSNQQRGAAVYSAPDGAIPPQPAPEEPGLIDAILRSSPGYVLGHTSAPVNAMASGFTHGMTAGLDQNLPGGQGVRDMRAQDAAAAPAPYHAADVVGATLSPVNFGGGPLRQAAGAYMQGAARSYSDADPSTPMLERLGNAAQAGVKPAVAAGTLGLIGKGMSATANGAQAVGDASRLRAWNTPAAAIENYADRNNLDASQAVRQFVDRGEQLVPPNVIVPRPTAGWETAARPVTSQLGSEGDEALAAAQGSGARLPADPRAELARRLYQGADSRMTSGQGGAVPEANALSNEARAVELGPQYTDPIALRQAKTTADRYAFRGEPGTPEAAAGQASLQHGNEIRGMLGDYVNQAGPEVAGRYNQAANDFGVAATIQGGARQGAIAGAPLGGRSIGIMGSAAAMVPKGAIPDAVANTARVAQTTLGAGGGALQSPAVPGATAALQQWLASKGGPQQQPANNQASGGSTGGLSGQRAEQALQVNPALLGKWAPQFQEAQQNGGSEAVNALIVKLALNDTEFRTGPYKQLSQGQPNGQ